MIQAQTSFSVKRIVNGKTLNFVLSANVPATQIFTPDPSTYAPDFTASPYLVITPALYISGQSSDQIAKLKAAPTITINGSATLSTFSATASASAPYALTIKKNLVSDSQYNIVFNAIYVEPVTLVEIPITATINIVKVSNTGTSIRAVAYAPQGQIFKNGQVSVLEAHCDMAYGNDASANVNDGNALFAHVAVFNQLVTEIKTKVEGSTEKEEGK